MRDDLAVLDADGHVIEPGEVLGEWIPPGKVLIDVPPGTPKVLCGDLDKIRDQASHGFDAPSYLRAMDAQGIDAAVLYPSIGLFVPFLPELSAEAAADACRAYNEWIARFCDLDPSRLAAVGVVPQRDPELAADVAREAARLDLVGVMVRPNHLQDANLGDVAFDPLYAALDDTDLVLTVHEALGVWPTIGADRFDTFAARHTCSHALEQMTAAVAILLGGALERHPTMRVAFLEAGSGWIPYWLHRLDEHREWLHDTECADLSLAPSEYFARQCIVSSDPEDALAAWTIARVGADHVAFASDFPHPDAQFPDAVDMFLDTLERDDVTHDDVATVLWDTPLRFYGLAHRFGTPAAVASE